jgi:hypothetical protein
MLPRLLESLMDAKPPLVEHKLLGFERIAKSYEKKGPHEPEKRRSDRDFCRILQPAAPTLAGA